MKSYITYHLHSDYSLLDSCTKFEEYADLAVKNGQRAIASTEHGKPLGWVSKKLYCDKIGLKFIHGVEIYLTESLDERVRDNYHTVLLAKNMDGIKELNELVSKSCDKEHFYYTNRISFDEFLGISDNIISTSACLASPLCKLPDDHSRYMELAQKYTFLEIQPHDCQEQADYNRRLYKLSKKIGKKLIAGTDTHSSTKYKAECRAVLLSAKHKSYGDEDAFDLSYKTYDELVEVFRAQDAIPEAAWLEAIDNTNLLDEMTEDFQLDKSIKYPILYGSKEADEQKFTETVEEMFVDKLVSGVIPQQQSVAFRNAINDEMAVFKKVGMSGFMLSMSELIRWCKEQGMAIGTARGSVGGSRVAYVTDIIDLNPETWHTVFSRFCNEDRVEVGDIDVDCVEADRPAIFKHIIQKFGADKTARVASFGTIQGKGVIDDVGRHLAKKCVAEHGENEPNPWSLQNIARIKNEFDADEAATKEKYPELFYYYDGLIGTKVSQSIHPAGIVISPITLADNYGVFDKDGDNCLMLDMDEAHALGLTKYDFLILKTVQVIRDTCAYLNQPYPRTHEIDWEDEAVWDDIVQDSCGIFQFESTFAFNSLRRFHPRNIFDMSLVTACIRPSGESYRDVLLARKKHENPSELIDELLKDNLGYLVYQEDTIKFLQQICGLSGSEADTIRRAIGHKDKEKLNAALPSILDGYCNKSPKPRKEAEEEAKEFLQVIEDSADYQFGYNHSVAYCLLGYLCAYYRHYHPLEFLTAFLNNAANDADVQHGTAYAEKLGIKVTMPKWGVSKGIFFFDRGRLIISKGLSSIKYMGDSVAEELYEQAHSRTFAWFVDVLYALNSNTSLNSRQLDILIQIDFFSDFGNQRELFAIENMFHVFKEGNAKQIKKAYAEDLGIDTIVSKYAVGVTKSGILSKSYTLLDVMSILHDIEDMIKQSGMSDFDAIAKARNFDAATGYAGYVSGIEEDRRKLFVLEVKPIYRRSDNRMFGRSVRTRSIGSGKETQFTVFNNVFAATPIEKGDIIYCNSYARDGKFFRLLSYNKIS